VYVFKRVNGFWQQTQKLYATNPIVSDQFGTAIAMDGTVAVAGTARDGGGTQQGAAYVFRLSGGTWVKEQKLNASGATYTFASSVAINGNLVLVGAPSETSSGVLFSGAAYVFEYTGSSWQQRQRLVPSDPAVSDSFGAAVAINGDSAVIGATGGDDGGTDSGATYIFRLIGSTWSQSQKLLASDDAAGDWFGSSASMSSTLLVIGAKNKYGPGLYAGAAYAFRKQSNTWVQENRLVVPTVTGQDYVGTSVAVSGETVLVGAPGSDFTALNGGRAWLYASSCSSNPAPVLTVTSPVNNSSYTQGQSVAFAASATDSPDGNITVDIEWTSSAQGFIGSGGSFSLATLQVGTHVITASVTDSGGLVDSETRTITINPTSNTQPSLTVTNPANNSSYTFGQTVTFTGTSSDTQDGDLTSQIQWTSNLQIPSLIGTGGSFTKNNLVVGTHTIIATVTDSGGLSNTRQRTITITASANTPPVANIFSPANNSSYTYGATVTFTGTASDSQDGNITANLSWTSSLQGFIGSGGSFTSNNLVAGLHIITATVIDSGGLQGSSARSITILPPSGNTAPVVAITSPVNNYTVTYGSPITFVGSASDTQDGNLTAALVWTSSMQGQIGTGGSFVYSTLSVGTHIITARATDSGGLQGTATRTVIITTPAIPNVDSTAISDMPVAGTVSGTYVATHTNNSAAQSIKEKETNGNPNNRYSYLEHKWTISVPTGGLSRTFHLNAWRTNSPDGDNFVFAYSTNNSTWTNMVTVTQTVDSGTYQVFTLPPNLSGTVYIRVKDTDQTPGHRNLDTIYIDHMFIRKQ